MNGIAIGKVLYTLLEGIDNVYPLVVDKEDVKFPFVVYRRSGLQNASTKDRYDYQQIADVEVAVASLDYSESIDVALQVLYRLEKTSGIYNNIFIKEIEMVDSDEDFIENTYVQRMNFKIKIGNIN